MKTRLIIKIPNLTDYFCSYFIVKEHEHECHPNGDSSASKYQEDIKNGL